MKAVPYDTERKRLKKAVFTAVEETKDVQNVLAANRSNEMQREQLALQKRLQEEEQGSNRRSPSE